MSLVLSDTDRLALFAHDNEFINQKGADAYTKGDYARAVEYYRLAAAMGDHHAVSNLGYCYMYGRSIEKNMSLAMAYFRLAALRGDIDAQYKLGSIYESGAEGVAADPEQAVYYYRQAAGTLREEEEDPVRYPSLHLALARAYMPGGVLICDLKAAYDCLLIAKEGFELEQTEGVTYHGEALAQTLRLLDDPCFAPWRAVYDDKTQE